MGVHNPSIGAAGSVSAGLKAAACLLAGLLVAGPAWADPVDQALGFTYGNGTLGSHLSQKSYIGLTYDFPVSVSWLQQLAWGFKVHAEADVARWRGCVGSYCDHVTDIGIAPVFRTLSLSGYGNWYLDLSIGAHLISTTRIGPQVYSTGFQFAEFAGTGLLLGEDRRYEVGLRYMHESNGDLKLPNDGMNFLQLRLALRW